MKYALWFLAAWIFLPILKALFWPVMKEVFGMIGDQMRFRRIYRDILAAQRKARGE